MPSVTNAGAGPASDHAAPGSTFQTADILTIALAHLAHDVFSSFLAPILPLLIAKHGFSYAMAGMLTVAQGAPSLLNPAVGILADRMPVRYFLIVAPALTAVVMSLLGIAAGYTVLVILLLIMGVSATLFHVPAPVMIRRVAGMRIGKGMSFFMLGGEAARTVGPFVILGAVSLWGLEGSWKLIPFGLLASGVLYFRLRKIPIADGLSRQKPGISIRASLRRHRGFFLLISVIILLQAMLKSALTAFLPVFITNSGGSIWLGGGALSIFQFAGAAGTLAAGTLSDRIGRRSVLLYSATAGPLIMWAFLLLDGVPALAMLLLLGLALFAPMPVMLAMVQELDDEHPAFLNGLYIGLSFLLGAVAVSITGALGDVFDLRLAYWITSIAALAALPFVAKLPETRGLLHMP